MGRAKTYYEARPRYTPGSPGQIGEELARRVAREEEVDYERAIEGWYGEGQKARAERLGLNHVVFSRTERRGGWDIVDLITGEERRVPFPGKIKAHYAKHPGNHMTKAGTRVEVEVLGPDPEERDHCWLVRHKWDGAEWSVARHELEYETKGRRRK